MNPPRKSLSAPVKLALDWAPLALFFLVTKFYPGSDNAKLFAATAVLMVAAVGAISFEYAMLRKVSPVPLVTAVVVLIFGALTLYLKDPRFIKMKPTVLYTLFGTALLGGLLFGRPFVKLILDQAFQLRDEIWRKLSFRFGLFFLAMAVLNELVWRNFSQNIWIDFKVFGTTGLTLLFTFSQMPLIMKHQTGGDAKDGENA